MKFKDEFFDIHTYLLAAKIHVAMLTEQYNVALVLVNELMEKASQYTDTDIMRLPISQYPIVVGQIIDEINNRVSPFSEFLGGMNE